MTIEEGLLSEVLYLQKCVWDQNEPALEAIEDTCRATALRLGYKPDMAEWKSFLYNCGWGR